MRYRDDDPLFYVRKHRSFRGLIVILLIIMIFSVSVVLVNAFINRQVQAVSRSVTIPSLPSSLEGFRILHISDLHGTIFGEGQEGISAAIKNLRYDIVVLTGDMLGSDGNFDGLISLLDLLGDKVPVFLIAGDEDPAPIPSTAHLSNQTKAEYVLAVETRGAVYLDVPYQLTVGKTVLWLCPESVYSTDISSTKHSMNYNLDLLEKSPETEDTKAAKRALVYWIDRLNRTEEALIAMKSADTKICVTHVPLWQPISAIRCMPKGVTSAITPLPFLWFLPGIIMQASVSCQVSDRFSFRQTSVFILKIAGFPAARV